MPEETTTRGVYRLNSPKVVCDVFEDEAVAINLDTGSYFGMAGTAREVWMLLAGEVPVEAIATHLAERYGTPREEVAADLDSFLNRLIEHGLVAETEGEGKAAAELAEAPAQGWEAPQVTMYDDMKDLLLLDPIHDVDEAGWPVRPPDTTTS